MIKRSLEALLIGHPGRYLEEGAPRASEEFQRRKGGVQYSTGTGSSLEGRQEAAMMVLSWSDPGEGAQGTVWSWALLLENTGQKGTGSS